MTGRRLLIEGDLSLDVDGEPIRITADGGRVVVQTARPAALVRHVVSAASALRTDRRPSLRTTASVVSALRRTGVAVELRGPRGTVVSLGGRSSGRSRLATAAVAGAGLVALAGILTRRTRRRR